MKRRQRKQVVVSYDRANMVSAKQLPTCAAIFIICTTSICGATILTTNFTNGKAVATSHKTLQPLTDIRCVRECFQEGRKGMCNVDGYNKEDTATCQLSVDSQQDVVDVTDEMSGVFYMNDGKYSI